MKTLHPNYIKTIRGGLNLAPIASLLVTTGVTVMTIQQNKSSTRQDKKSRSGGKNAKN